MKKRENVYVFNGTPQWNYPTLHNNEVLMCYPTKENKESKREQDSASTIENQYNINTCIKTFHTSLLAKYLICIPYFHRHWFCQILQDA